MKIIKPHASKRLFSVSSFLTAIAVVSSLYASHPLASEAVFPLKLIQRNAISAGDDHSLGILSDGSIIAWGYAYHGRSTPPQGVHDAVGVIAGSKFSLALRSNGTVVAWGENANGRATPPENLHDVIAIAAGPNHALALRANGTVVGWGDDSDDKTTPPDGLDHVVAIAAAATYSVALKDDGSVTQWGKVASPVPENLDHVVAIAAGKNFTLALRSNGTVVGWGDSFYSQSTPPADAVHVVDIAACEESAVALKDDGSLVGWGRGKHPSPEVRNIVAVSIGATHGLALSSDGKAYGWGFNYKGKAHPPEQTQFATLKTSSLVIASTGVADSHPEELVDPMIAAQVENPDISHGSDMPGPCLPHASVYPSPETFNPPPSGYRPSEPIVGFAQLHTLGTGGNPSYGHFLITPRIGLYDISQEYPSTKSHEVAKAYKYDVDLLRDAIHVEIAPSIHSAIYAFTFPSSENAHLTLDVSRKVGGDIALDEGSVEVNPQTGTITGGGIYSKNYNPQPFHLYFAAKISSSPLESGTWKGEKISMGVSHAAARGQSLGAILRLSTKSNQPVYMKIAVSFTSVEKAKFWLDNEIPDWDITKVEAKAKAIWHDDLTRLSLEGASKDVERKIFTAYWHAMIQPRNRTGDVMGFDPNKQLWDDHYTLWDTWQTLFPFLSIMDPQTVTDNVNAFINRYEHNDSKYVAEAFIDAHEFKIGQGGNETDNVIADAFARKIPGVDWNKAYEILKHDADNARTAWYRDHGWVASDEKTDYSYRMKSGSGTLAFSYNDYLTAQVALALGHKEDYDHYLARSHNWVNVFDPAASGEGFSNFVRARSKTGEFSKIIPTKGYNTDFYEGTSWEFSFSVLGDTEGLIQTMGGKDMFIKRLIYALKHNYIDFTNEPSFRIPWLFNAVNRPYLTSYWANQFLQKYPGNYLPGDDDSAAMSTLYIFLNAGIFPLAGKDIYYLHGGRVPKLSMHLTNGKTFTIISDGASENNIYIQKAFLNATPLNDPIIHHSDIMSGGVLKFIMGPAPSAWGTNGEFDLNEAIEQTKPLPKG
jgi:predicted alpha-1,2-mannosidase